MSLLVVESLLIVSFEFMHSLMRLMFELILNNSNLFFLGRYQACHALFFLKDHIYSISLLPDLIFEQRILFPLLL